MALCRQTGTSPTFGILIVELLNRISAIEQKIHDAEIAKALEKK
jgi:hypothetical protein